MMTYEEEVRKMKEYTEAVRRTWVQKKIYDEKGAHDPEVVSSDYRFTGSSKILLEKWGDVMGITVPVRPNQLYERILEVELFLRQLLEK